MTAPVQEALAGLPSERSLLVAYLSRERAFKGIGPRRAAALGKALGPDLKQALLDVDERVIEIVGEESAITAAVAMETRQAETQFLDWLASVGANVPAYKAIRIARAWGPQGVKAIERNPYLLLAVIDWQAVDRIARALGCPDDDPRRDVAALESSLTGETCLGRGSTRLPLIAARIAAEGLLGRPLAPGSVDAAVASGAAIRLSAALQPPGAAHMEAESALGLARLARQAPLCGVTPDDDLNTHLATYETKQPFSLTEKQREAVRLVHRYRLVVLAGYAGSGKTSVLRGICETLEAIGRPPLIVTLSGRAAKRAADVTGRRAITVARFLLERDEAGQALSAHDALIADEASMLGLVEMWRILRRLGSASLLLCGDPAQLPPVSPGIVFHRLAADRDVLRVTLDRVHRQHETTGIPTLAEGVRLGRIGGLPGLTGAAPGVTFTPCNRDMLPAEILRIGRLLTAAGTARSDMQIVAPTNLEISIINDYFHRRRREATGSPLWPGLGHIAEGDPVIWTKNDLERGLTNGSMGRLLMIAPDKIVAELDGVRHTLSASDGQFLSLAYAVSVHKAQGSQWRRVIVPVFGSRVLDRSLIYTALTRAQEQVIFLGNYKALKAAVSRSPVAEQRDCGFEDWLTLAREHFA